MKKRHSAIKKPKGIKVRRIVGLIGIMCLFLGLKTAFLSPGPLNSPPQSPQVWVKFTEGTKQIALEDFLIGVVAAEMPASFPLEALKAQAIAARTYIYLHSPLSGRKDEFRHPDAAVCCDPAHCQAWQSPAQRQAKWGANSVLYEKKIKQAINETTGMLITYNGKPAEAPYSACCGGKTEAAGDLWGSDIPWLQSVPCLWDEATAVYATQEVFSLKQAADLLGIKQGDLKKMAVLQTTAGGRVFTLKAGATTLKGSRVRSLLRLRSAAFSWQIAEEKIVFYVQGYGHGVGLCQYGAGGMAKAGYLAEEILAHYFSGTALLKAY